ncbi:MAG: penicillin-binding transpeptidase domain-containing protein [Corynebacterium sp.]|nr:penicillin-binding transpeptidase domain-containing protein [Corynebacterium sp.]
MKSAGALIATIILVVLTACTPKPEAPDPTVKDFLQAIGNADFAKASTYTDSSSTAQQALQASYDGLQAESVSSNLDKVDLTDTTGSNATASYTLTWNLPKDRHFSYQTQVQLSKNNGRWVIRWQPTAIHPSMGANQHLELRALQADRAGVVSADGQEVLAPGQQYRVVINPQKVSNVAGASTRVAQALQNAHNRDGSIATINASDLARTLADFQGNYSVATVNSTQGPMVQTELADVDGVSVNAENTLINVDPDFAPDIMARVSSLVEDELDGNNGWAVVIANANGAQIETLQSQAPTPSPSVRVSLDHNVQQAAQEALQARASSKAMMVVIRPSTGEILAVAQTKSADEDGDVALNGQYPPGSTFKMITSSAGMTYEGMNPDTIVPCPGNMEIGPRIVTNYNAFSLGNVTMRKAFAQSCNTSFADVSSRLQPGQLATMGKSFGLGLDYDIPGLTTITGSIPNGDDITDRAESGFGQGLDLASPFGMALVAATAAHGSTPVPTLISGHETKVSEQVAAPDPAVISNLRDMMRAVVTTGTARGMRAGGTIYGKTGEAEITGGSHAWFAGYRDDDIAFATLVVLGGGSEISVSITDRFFQRLDALRAGQQ